MVFTSSARGLSCDHFITEVLSTRLLASNAKYKAKYCCFFGHQSFSVHNDTKASIIYIVFIATMNFVSFSD